MVSKSSDNLDQGTLGQLDAARWGDCATSGHFDELRGKVITDTINQTSLISPDWQDFFTHLGEEGWNDLNRKTDSYQFYDSDHSNLLLPSA